MTNKLYHNEILAITKLTLTNFRNYSKFNLQFSPQPIIITGTNGIGKTNILESVSLFSPGRGLRNAKLVEIGTKVGDDFSSWQVSALADCHYGNIELVTAHQNIDEKIGKRVIKINDQPMKSQSELAKIFSVIWLTPQMDQLFLGPSSTRRRFIDRLVLNFDAEHANRVANYEHVMSQRLKLLKSNKHDNFWLNALEQSMAELAMAIAAARIQTIDYLQAMIDESDGIFPKALLTMTGELEQQIANMPSLELEQIFKKKLSESRQIDFHSGRTNAGIHRSDLLVYQCEKNIEAARCSTGEQKALLISIILAEAKARIKWRSSAPVLLLDEVIAHLDEQRRDALFQELLAIKAQCWITATDINIFANLKNYAQFYEL